jgi:Domain of unknown function (DUF4328)
MAICPHCERPTDSDPCPRCGSERAWSLSPLRRTYSVGTLAVITVITVALSSVTGAISLIADSLLPPQLLNKVLALLASNVQLAAAILVIVWLWRTIKNIEAFPGRHTGMGPGWAIGAWFVPIANIWLPFRLMLQVAAEELSGGWFLPAIVVWWVSYLTSSLMVLLIPGDSRPELADTMAAAGTFVLAGIALCVLVFTIGRAQQDRIDRALARRAAVPEPSPSPG